MPRTKAPRGLHELSPWDDDGALHVVVECPRGSQVKLKWDPKLGAMKLGRTLVLGATFPFELGFVPSTRAEDGDPLDAAVLADAPTAPGVVVACRPVAVLCVTQRDEGGRRIRNDRLVCVATEDRRRAHVRRLADLDARLRAEIEVFFADAVALEGKEIAFEGWGDEKAARERVERTSRRRRRG